MHLKHLAFISAAVVSVATAASLVGIAAKAAGPVQFRPHDIDPKFTGGYAVNVADFNKDGKIDVVVNSLQVQELAWYENPTWQRHVIVSETQQIVNDAMADIDGDGIPEVAFQSSFAMQAANSQGHNWIARSQGDPKGTWKVEKIDAFPTSHHVAWADLDGDGKKELLNAPLIGEKSLAPGYDQDKASVFWYDTKTWTRHLVTQEIPGIIHRVRPVNWDNDKREEVLVASFEGIVLYKASGSGESMKFEKTLLSAGHGNDKAPRLGTSDVGVGKQNGAKFFGAVEPWHGNEVVVYNEVGGKWQRRVIYDKLTNGHEVAVVDLNGDGRSDVVANDNSRVTEQRPNATPGVYVFYAPDDPVNDEWTMQRLEDKSAMNSCVGVDINGDKRMDLVCTGGGAVVRWYENIGAAAGTASAR
jgi:FG-GAP-like repeat/Aldos-2-ulose dehydratase, beta-propeller domain